MRCDQVRKHGWLLVLGFACVAHAASAIAAPIPLRWSRPVRVDASHALLAISCSSASLCVASDDSGSIVVSRRPAASAPAWRRIKIDRRRMITAVSCAPRSLCVAGDNDGDVLTSPSPRARDAIWRRWHVDRRATFLALSCPSKLMCVGVDNHGNVVSSHDPTVGASWQVAHIDPTDELASASCPTVSLCFVGDLQPGSYIGATSDLFATSNPTGGAAAWTLIRGIPSGLVALSCPSSFFCAAVDAGNGILTSVNPLGGSTTWHLKHLKSPRHSGQISFQSVSCPSTSFCAVADVYPASGRILISTDPEGTGARWATARIDSGELLGVSCPSTALCVAIDGNGNVVVGTRRGAHERS